MTEKTPQGQAETPEPKQQSYADFVLALRDAMRAALGCTSARAARSRTKRRG